MTVPPLLALSGVTKRYPGIVAVDDVSLDVRAGEVHALLGENGAGKSTLVKVMCGLVRPDAGTLAWQGQPLLLAGPQDARARGIAVVFQHFSLFDAMTVAENVALGLSGCRADGHLARRIEDLSARYGLAIQPHDVVADLSVGERQRVEIVRALMQDPALLILDEPTSVLTPQESDALFATVRRLTGEGLGVLFISHKLAEIRAHCDRATVLRRGKVVATCDPRAETPARLAELMVGERLPTPRRERSLARDAAIRLAVSNLSQVPNPFSPTGLHHVNFTLHAGEVLGIAGVAGNGQNALLAALSGEIPAPAPETVLLDGRAVGHSGPQARRARGLAYVPPDRMGTGAVPELDLADNALLSAYRRLAFAVRGVLQPGKTRKFADDVVRRFDVRTTGVNARAASLSGGNLQKFIVGREILQTPSVLVAAHPTWGVDAGAAAAIHQALLDLADAGAAVLIVSEDLDELVTLADRIAVLCAGRLSLPIPAAEADPAKLGLLMAGEALDAAA